MLLECIKMSKKHLYPKWIVEKLTALILHVSVMVLYFLMRQCSCCFIKIDTQIDIALNTIC